MAATIAVLHRGVMGNRKYAVATVTPDSSYPNTGTFSTSGYVINPSDLGFAVAIDYLDATPTTSAGRIASWDSANTRLHVYSTTTAEIANTVDASASVFQVLAFGK